MRSLQYFLKYGLVNFFRYFLYYEHSQMSSCITHQIIQWELDISEQCYYQNMDLTNLIENIVGIIYNFSSPQSHFK